MTEASSIGSTQLKPADVDDHRRDQAEPEVDDARRERALVLVRERGDRHEHGHADERDRQRERIGEGEPLVCGEDQRHGRQTLPRCPAGVTR